MDFMLYPYGNARQTQASDGSWTFDCQHGEDECTGNLIEACAIHLNNATKTWFPMIKCIEGSNKLPAKSAPKCASDNGIDYKPILACTTSSLGNKVMHQIGSNTDNLNPPHKWTPWVVMNGTPLTDDQLDVDLYKTVCAAYRGNNKPAACSSTLKTSAKLCKKDE